MSEPNSEKVKVIAIKTIQPLPTLNVGESNFFSDHDIAELAKKQGVSPITDSTALTGGFPSDEDVDSFLKGIYENRK